MPYLIPKENALTDDLICKRIFIPDRIEYRAAMLGALGYFAKWVAWQDTSGNRLEKSVADMWKVAFEKTLEYWLDGCQEMTEEEIRDLINQELENMTIQNCITVNCGNLCCGSTSGLPDIVPPEDIPGVTPPPIVDPPLEPPNTTSYSQYNCDMANYIVYQFRTASMQLRDILSIGKTAYGDIEEIFLATMGILVPGVAVTWATYYVLVTYALSYLADTSAAMIASAIDGAYSQFVCAILSGDGLDQKRENFRAVIDELPLSSPLRYWLKLIEQNIPYEVLYNEDWELYDFGTYPTGRDCSGCSGFIPGTTLDPIDKPVLPPQYALLPPRDIEVVLAQPTADGNSINKDMYYYGNIGKLADVDIKRSATLARGRLELTVNIPTANEVTAEIGEGWTFLGWLVAQGDIVESPSYDTVRSISYGVNMALAGYPQWLDGQNIAMIIPGAAGDLFIAETDYTPYRYADGNTYIGLGADQTKSIKYKVESPDDSPYVGTNVTIDLKGWWAVYLVGSGGG